MNLNAKGTGSEICRINKSVKLKNVLSSIYTYKIVYHQDGYDQMEF